MSRTIFCLSLFAACAGGSAPKADVLLHDEFSSDSLGRYDHPVVYDIFDRVPEPAAWQVRSGRLEASGTAAPWSYQLRGDPAWTDYALSATIVIGRAQTPGKDPKPRVYPLYQVQARDYFGELAPDYEVALIARHTGEDRFYRLQFSARWQEVAIWEPSAGILTAGACELKVGRPHRIRWQLQGNHLQVWVDDKKTIDVWDRLKPFRRGRVGLGVYDADVSFNDVHVRRLAPGDAAVPKRVPHFVVKPWHGEEWIFDGTEPVARISDDWYGYDYTALHEAKLRPGSWPVMHERIGWRVHGKFPDKQRTHKVIQQAGPQLRIDFHGRYSHLDHLASRRVLTLSYDPALDCYVWHFDCELACGPGWREKRPTRHLELTDPYLSNACAPPVGVKRPWRALWEWALLKGPDGKLWKFPLHHNMPYFRANHRYVCKQGFTAFALNETVNPVWEMLTDPEGMKLWQASCGWSYDHHLTYDVPTGYKLQAGTKVRSVFRVVSYPRAKMKALFDRAALHPQFDLSKAETKQRVAYAASLEAGPPRLEFLVSTIGRNDFGTTRSLDTPHAEYMIQGNYEIDRAVGHGDSRCLRLDGPGFAQLDPCGGPSYYGDAFKADRYVLSLWVKTRDVRGTGPVVYLQDRHRDKRATELVPGLNGSNDWTKIQLVTDIPKGSSGLRVRLDLRGTGTAWFDELQLRPLGPEEVAPKPTPSRTKPRPTGDVVCTLGFTEGTGIGVLDTSGHDNHARLADGEWVAVEGRPAVALDGRHGHLLVPMDASLRHPKGFTVAMWIRPAQEQRAAGAGGLLSHYSHILFALQGARAPYGLYLGLSTGGTYVRTSTPAVIPADKWTHVALTFDTKQIVLYVDGTRKAGSEAKGDATFTDWEHFFLGSRRAQGNWYRGLLGGLTIWKKALTATQVKANARSGRSSRSLGGVLR